MPDYKLFLRVAKSLRGEGHKGPIAINMATITMPIISGIEIRPVPNNDN